MKSSSQVLTSDGSCVICTINRECVRVSLGLPLPIVEQFVTQFSELYGLAGIKALTPEEITSFMAKLLTPDVNQTQDTFRYDLSSFIEPIQAILPLLSQVLGLYSDQSSRSIREKASNMKFKYTIEPFVVNSIATLVVVQNILKGMNFQVDKKLNYDPKHIISQRKTSSRLGNYEYVEDEVLALIANHSYIEHDVDMSSNEQEEHKGSKAQVMVDPITGTITSFKGERTLKRPATKVTNMEIDTTTKKLKVSTQGKEIVTLENDEEESINQTKGFPITKELSHSKEASHPTCPSLSHCTSHSERTISRVVISE